ncbi:CagY family CD-EC repeat-containing protein [Prescottella equi]|uniref:CagY family CD-EC repeat-containing protein n=1 Tax=Rhodococcus hoagii TaxID=43767 RepID=UPI0020C5FF8A|nr:CagY family CD-EC repeat-containing protein [Prescottella equi]
MGLLFCLVPLTGFIGLILGVIGLALGLAGLSRVRKAQASNKGVTISGIVLSALAVVGGIAGIVIVFTAVDQLGDDLNQISNDWDSYSECISNADTPEEMNACN